MSDSEELATLRKFSATQVAELLKAQQQIERLQTALTAAEAVNQERVQVMAEQAAEIAELRALLPEVGNEVTLPDVYRDPSGWAPLCDECGKTFTREEWDNRHGSDIDCHAACCTDPECAP